MGNEFEIEALTEKCYAKYSLAGFSRFVIPSFMVSSYSIFLWLKISKVYEQYDSSAFKLGHILQPSWYFTPYILLLSFILINILYKFIGTKKSVILYFIILFCYFVLNTFFKKNIYGYSISQNFIDGFFFILSGISFGIILYFIRFIQVSRISLNERNMEIKTGVFSENVDSTDLHRITDKDHYRTFLDKLLGTRTLMIKSSDDKEKRFIKGLKNTDALNVYNFIKAHSFSSAVELWRAKDTRTEKRNQNKNNRNLSEAELLAIMDKEKEDQHD